MPDRFLKTLSPQETGILRHVLAGGSVIDWPALHFSNADEVRLFLRINEFDLTRQKDRDRLFSVHNEALGYLQSQLQLALPEILVNPENLIDAFLIASKKEDRHPGDRGLKQRACSLLKTMNIINHIDGRELLYNCPISLRDLFSLVQDKIERSLSLLAGGKGGSPLIRYEGGRKPKESLITKLLSRKETIAAQIYDRVRYRIVTKTREDILRVILHLFHSVLPFNYVTPLASSNQLIDFNFKTKAQRISKALSAHLSPLRDPGEYSGKNYRTCKFVVDIPVRLDNFLASSAGPQFRESLGTVAYVLVEFQIVDEVASQLNNSGESSHDQYKSRQKKGVLKRLLND